MLGFRIEPPGPFWLEDLVFLVMDEARALPNRTLKVAAHIRRLARKAQSIEILTLLPFGQTGVASQQVPVRMPAVFRETPRLDQPEEWALATEPLAAVGTGTTTAVTLHKAADEQLDALTYVLTQMRAELRPVMSYARLKGDEIHHLPTQTELDNSIDALLELSRKNAATRPKDRVHTAA
ncbi:MAG TPA: hypothetical protein VEA77_01605 [Hyphomicrobium sp.]|nr:hypothetical protein [Hyphomicrobium sp.]